MVGCEHYAEKLKKYHKLKTDHRQLQQRLSLKVSEVLIAKDNKETQISELLERIGLRKKYVEEETKAAQNDKEELKQLKKTIEDKRKKAKVHQQKMDKIARYIEQLKKNLSVLQTKLEEKEQKLCDLRRKSLHQMTEHLFPISYITRSDDEEEEEEEEDATTRDEGLSQEASLEESEDSNVVAKLAEARRTSYVKGRWVYADDSQESQYSIVHPSASLPANGEYSAFTAWIISQEDPYTNLELHNPGHQTLGAMSYVAQLTQHIAWYLGIPLPKRLSFSYFCLKELDLKEFSFGVEKLNVNVLYLCCTQGVDPEFLHPRSPLGNLWQLIKCKSPLLGRCLPFEIYADLLTVEMTPPSSATSLVSSTSYLPETLEESESSSNESEMGQEWETVPDLDVSLIPSDATLSTTDGGSQGASRTSSNPEEPMGASHMTQAAGSLVSSAATVASALWRVASRQYDKS
ncbi:putative beclin 1-associated autophagy-related key regulator [Apostichopus japonicus]|uniref:Putative beclin 1-associated autophagy-related key regulator n=1 Tax=Stichopus japonicus TaxID=307972 RepID=A0A2G8JYG8_STIJA|nr:putative beclin 1-associated autophagy-related key regulator [Apostichopus japonicus]